MTINIDSHTVEISCPGCKQKIKQTIGWLKANSPIECPGCHKPITINATELDKGVSEMNKQINDLRTAFKNIGKR